MTGHLQFLKNQRQHKESRYKTKKNYQLQCIVDATLSIKLSKFLFFRQGVASLNYNKIGTNAGEKDSIKKSQILFAS